MGSVRIGDDPLMTKEEGSVQLADAAWTSRIPLTSLTQAGLAGKLLIIPVLSGTRRSAEWPPVRLINPNSIVQARAGPPRAPSRSGIRFRGGGNGTGGHLAPPACVDHRYHCLVMARFSRCSGLMRWSWLSLPTSICTQWMFPLKTLLLVL